MSSSLVESTIFVRHGDLPMGKQLVMKDAFGTITKVGDTIVYVSKRGSTVDFHKAKVLLVAERPAFPGSDIIQPYLEVELNLEVEPAWKRKRKGTALITESLFVVMPE